MKKNRILAISFGVVLVLMLGVQEWAAAPAQTPPPLSIARQGYLFAGGKYSNIKGKEVVSGQLYAEFMIPANKTHPNPIVMVHGGGQTGTVFLGTPDGREGWAQFFLREGYAVYVVDQVGRGRSAYVPDVYGQQGTVDSKGARRYTANSERDNLWPQAHLHTQWPGKGEVGDPVYDQLTASQVSGIPDFTLMQKLNRDAIVALLDKIGPSILLVFSETGAVVWPVADARPDKVQAIIAVEPNSPPFYNVENVGAPEWFSYSTALRRPWGITSIPLTFSPPAPNPSDLAIVQQEKPDAPDLVRCWVQKEPVRQLPNLQKMPILILISEASFHTPVDHCTAKFLQQAGTQTTMIRLADVGIHGNSHLMLMEKNNMEIAGVLSQWLTKELPNNTRRP